eukprot:scaffold14025_cov67-Skeletonema_dohrnii-CCMP3373.AAC.1
MTCKVSASDDTTTPKITRGSAKFLFLCIDIEFNDCLPCHQNINRADDIIQPNRSKMRSLISLLVLLTPQLPIVRASDDLWAQYMAQMEAKKYESTISRRERNLDHWDVPTAAAYLGLHPETLKPLPQHASEELPSSSSDGSGDATELLD